MHTSNLLYNDVYNTSNVLYRNTANINDNLNRYFEFKSFPSNKKIFDMITDTELINTTNNLNLKNNTIANAGLRINTNETASKYLEVCNDNNNCYKLYVGTNNNLVAKYDNIDHVLVTPYASIQSGQSGSLLGVQPTVQPIVQPTVQPIVQPTVQPIVQPTVQPIVQPAVQSSTQSTDQSSTQPAT